MTRIIPSALRAADRLVKIAQREGVRDYRIIVEGDRVEFIVSPEGARPDQEPVKW